MKRTITFLMVVACGFTAIQAADEPDYSSGALFVNEGWYGHGNGTLNYLSDLGEWTYHAFRKSNPGKELGCSSQYATIYGDRLYVVSKQERDPGASITGSRLTVCDARTLKCIKEFPVIATDAAGKSIADGRSFVGVDEHKGYLGTSNGIYLFDIDRMEIGRRIDGTSNPNDDPYGQLYKGQVGTMVRTACYVFAVHQQNGLLVIDPQADTLVTTILPPTYIEKGQEKLRGFGSVVQSKDGMLWISLAANTSGSGATLPEVWRLDPVTFDVETIAIPTAKGIEDIPNSWYAWTADPFCASVQENKLYWGGNNGNSWFKNRRIFCYDIDRKQFSKVFDFDAIPGSWVMYGSAFRLHPETDELYCGLYHDFLDPNYEVMRLANNGTVLQEYPMITDYWFPALPVFFDHHLPEISTELIDMTIDRPTRLYLGDKVTDRDNLPAAIVKRVVSVYDEGVLKASVRNDSLILTPQSDRGTTDLLLSVNSNGKVVEKLLQIVVSPITSIDAPQAGRPSVVYSSATGLLTISTPVATEAGVFDLTGRCVCRQSVDEGNTIVYTSGWSPGVYVVKVGIYTTKIVIR